MEPLFDYPDEEIVNMLIKRQKRREYMAKWLGRPIGEWGGKRKGAGRFKKIIWDVEVRLQLNKFQKKLLEELGKGNARDGILELIKEKIGD